MSTLSLFSRLSILAVASCLLISCGTAERKPEEKRLLQRFCSSQGRVPVSPYLAAAAQANNDFSLSLYSRLSQSKGNVLISGYSVGTVLAMTHAGAAGETAAQIARALRMPAGLKDLAAAESSLMSQALCGAQDKGYTVSIANGSWLQQGFTPLPRFIATLATDYAARAATLDFEGRNAEAIAAINEWTNAQTNGLIPKLFDRLDTSTRLVLANAIYFKAPWAVPFPVSGTTRATFYVGGTTAAAVPMMSQITQMSYGPGTLYDVVEIPYARQGYAMDIFLPHDRNGLSAVESAVVGDTGFQWLKLLAPASVKLALPKFAFAGDFGGDTMIPALEALGIKDLFDLSSSDLSRIDGERDLFVSQIVHKTFIQVNEEEPLRQP